MSESPTIPYGYKRVTGRSQKGDGRWNGMRFEKVKKEYPAISDDQVVIRRCVVVQAELTGTDMMLEQETTL